MKTEEVRSKTDSELEFELGQMSQKLFEVRFKAGVETSPIRGRSRRSDVQSRVFIRS
jgi:ribosomal protein L29